MTIDRLKQNHGAAALTYRDVTYMMKDEETGCIIFLFLYHKGSGVVTRVGQDKLKMCAANLKVTNNKRNRKIYGYGP